MLLEQQSSSFAESDVFDLQVSTSQPVIDLYSRRDESSKYVHIQLVLHDSGIDASVSSPSWI